MATRSITFLLLLILLGISSWALFNPNFFYIHDYLHAARIAEMARGLGNFHIPVRWSQNFGYGYGMPLFEFYAPLPYFVGALFFLVGFGAVASMQIIFVISNLVTILGSYFLGKKLFGKTKELDRPGELGRLGELGGLAGLILAAVYGLAPYRAVNLYVRGALSESWGMMFFPLILLFGIKYLKKTSYFNWLGLTLCISGLFLSHNLSALLFLPLSALFFGAYALFIIDAKSKIVLVSKLATSYFLAFLLSSFYVMPALMEKSFTKLESFVTGGYFDYKLHFVGVKQFFDSSFGYGGSGWEASDEISFFLGWGVLLGIFLTGLTVAFYSVKKRKVSQQALFLFFVLFLGVLSLLMSHNKSLPIWQLLDSLKFLQFPWRWLASAAIYFAIFSAGFLWFIPKKNIRVIFAGLIILLASIPAVNFFKPESFLENANQYYFSDPERIKSELSQVLPDYLPTNFSSELTNPPEAIAWSPDPDTTQIKTVTNSVHKKVVEVTASENTNLIFAVADYPGWQVYIDDNPVEHDLSPDGLISTQIPAGEKLVSAKFNRTPIRMLFDSISGLSLFALAIASIIAVNHRKKSG